MGRGLLERKRGKEPLIAHFNGTSPGDVSAVGVYCSLANGKNGFFLTARHWNGTAWSEVNRTKFNPIDYNTFSGGPVMAATSGSGIWYAGYYDVYHFNGLR